MERIQPMVLGAWLLVSALATARAVDPPPRRCLPVAPTVHRTFDEDQASEFPSDFYLDGYDAGWLVTTDGAPYGNVVSATQQFNDQDQAYLSHLVYSGTAGEIHDGVVPGAARYYVEALMHIKQDGAYHSDEHTLQAYWLSGDFNMEVVILAGQEGWQWKLILYGNGCANDFDRSYNARTLWISRDDGTPETGWDWWARVGLEIDRTAGLMTVFYNGQPIQGPDDGWAQLLNVHNPCVNTTDTVRTTLRAVNNTMDYDDFRIYLLGPIGSQDGDPDVDLADVAHLQRCVTGSKSLGSGSPCGPCDFVNADVNRDAQIDTGDVLEAISRLTGPR